MEYSDYIKKIEQAIKDYESERDSLADRDDGWIEDAQKYKKMLLEEFVDKIPHRHIRVQIYKYINKDAERKYRQDIANLLYNFYSFTKYLAGVPCNEEILDDNRYYCDKAAKDVADNLNKIIGHIEYLSVGKSALKENALEDVETQLLNIWEELKKYIDQETIFDLKDILSYRYEA